ncbi:NAD(P)/FAD-dependent oxidoreductase [Oxalobacteraceae bacterium OM1]|nr:NAD(P)/FAD-dependent oxidoreductase [Oxalobacteraceae bacterium OM1]
MKHPTKIAVIGAGPYGLSIAAHLQAYRANFRIVGTPMQSWLENMPQGMSLKSAGFASSLFEPSGRFTLAEFCRDKGIAYADVDHPVTLETFCNYALAFQKQLVPHLEVDRLVSLTLHPDGFSLHFNNGESWTARKVVLATGIDNFRRIPQALQKLPRELYSHSAEHRDPAKFKGRDVVVLGAGASAIDLAVLLHEAGARVRLVARRRQLDFGKPWGGSARPILSQMRAPISGIGPGWSCRLATDLPGLFRYLPDKDRLHIARTALGPAAGWFMHARAAAVPVLPGHELSEASPSGTGVLLRFNTADRSETSIETEHVIAATGYEPDIRRLPFLSPAILAKLHLIGKTPRLSSSFESSVPGLHFVGPIAATSFGPVMRFMVGAGFASQRIARHFKSARYAGS